MQVETEEPRIQDNSQLCSEFKDSPQNSFPLLRIFGINPVPWVTFLYRCVEADL